VKSYEKYPASFRRVEHLLQNCVHIYTLCLGWVNR